MAKLERAIIPTLATAACVLILLQAHQLSELRAQIQSLQQQQRSAAERIQQLQQRDETTRLQSPLRCNDDAQSHLDRMELLRLRGKISVLRSQLSEKLQDEERQADCRGHEQCRYKCNHEPATVLSRKEVMEPFYPASVWEASAPLNP